MRVYKHEQSCSGTKRRCQPSTYRLRFLTFPFPRWGPNCPNIQIYTGALTQTKVKRTSYKGTLNFINF